MGINTISFSSGGKNYISYQDSLGYTLILDQDGLVAEELDPGETLEANSKLYKGKEVKAPYSSNLATNVRDFSSSPKSDSKPYVYTPKKPCHEGLSKVFTWNGMDFYAGGWREEKKEIVGKISTALMIDLDNNISEPVKSYGLSKESKAKLSGFEKMKCIKVTWPDYGSPPLEKNFWERLIEIISLEGRDVVVFCYGGHGRTGTFLAVLAALLGVTDAPVEFIRKNHCIECVESWSQIEYIEEICGIEVKEKPNKTYTYSGAGFGGNSSLV